ncbi:MAG: GcvT family protein [Actinobacteria bacterium]|nr:GcvT family protein [Actinomycetota bacterium]
MKDEARVVVIGGGIVGVAVLYHLTKLGWNDVVLVERKQLTAGSTWHAAAGFHSLNGSLSMARLQAYSIQTYDEVEAISGQDVGMHRTGSVACAATPEWWDFLKVVSELNRTLGIESYLIDGDEVPKHSRIIDASQVIGALVDPADGYLDPFGATHAYAKAARLAGAEVYQQTLVTALQRNDDDTWNVVTDQGTIHAEHVVNAGGLWAREVAAMAGHRVPLVPYEHHYLVTEPLAEIRAQTSESMTTVDLDGGIYVREEVGGLLFGVYEHGPTPWSLGGTPWTYGESELLSPRLDALAPTLEHAFRRFPLMQNAGIKNVVNGPFTFTPDGNPLVGPVRGLPNYWLACGCMAGFSQSGGIALALAQWMITGEPDGDTFAMDPARFGSFANDAYALETSTQFYEWRFKVPFPNEPWPAGRPAKTTPIYDLQLQAGGVFAAMAAVEVPMWFARAGEVAHDIPSFSRGNNFAAVAAEVGRATSAAGLIDISSYSKFEVSGPGARAWLDSLLASTLPSAGRGRLAVMLSDRGSIIGDFTLFCLPSPLDGSERFLLTGSGPVQEWHMRWFHRYLPAPGVTVRNVTDELMGVAVVGPRSRDVLQRLTRHDLSAAAFTFMSVAEMDIGRAPAIVDRVSLTGELGFEVWVPTMYHRSLYTQLLTVGADDGIGNVGALALLSMRLEKGFGIWGREFSSDYRPVQNDMHHFVAADKRAFVGRDATLADQARGASARLVTLEVAATTSDATGFEPVYLGDRTVGYVTSGGFGHRTQKSLALAYINADDISPTANYEVPLIGVRHPATLLVETPFDPSGSRMRS